MFVVVVLQLWCVVQEKGWDVMASQGSNRLSITREAPEALLGYGAFRYGSNDHKCSEYKAHKALLYSRHIPVNFAFVKTSNK